MSRLLTRKLFTSIRPSFARSLATAQTSQNAAVPQHVLDSIEVSWAQMTEPQREELREQLAEIQKQDWSKLSIKEKRAAYYVAFGPHGPRAPFPKYTREVFFGTSATLVAAALLFFGIHSFAGPAPHTVTKEWQEATNEYMKSQKANPISGYTSEGYKGKGWVTVD